MKKETRIQHILRSIVRYVVASASLSIVFYILFALIFSKRSKANIKQSI